MTEHTVAGISVGEYERLFFDEPLNEAICADLAMERTLLSREVDAHGLRRTVRVRPRRRVPLVMRRLVDAAGVAYLEEMVYAFGTYRADWTITPMRLAERAHAAGTVTFHAADDGCRRRVEGHVDIRIPGLGGMAERLIAADIERSFARAAAFTTSWWARHRADGP